MTLHTYTPYQCPYQVSTSYTLQFLRYSPDKLFPEIQSGQDLIGQGHYARSKVTSRSPHDIVPSYTLRFLRYSPDKISKLEGHYGKVNQGHKMTLHTLPMSLLSINFLHLTVSEIQPGQTFSRYPPIQTP